MMHRESLAVGLYEAGCVRFGRFKLKSGAIAPFFLDLRSLVSDPATLWQAAGALSEVINTRSVSFDRIAAIPYAALPIGVALSLTLDHPMIYLRKEISTYGTSNPIEGRFEPGDKVLVVDDLITQGDSKLQTIAWLQEAGLVVENVLVIIDQQQEGERALAEHGYRLDSVLTLCEMLEILLRQKVISKVQHAETWAYLEKGFMNLS